MRTMLPILRLFSVLVVAVALNTAGDTQLCTARKAQASDYVGQLSAELQPTRVLTYKTVDGRKLHLNMFDPKGLQAGDNRPCFFSIHGGGWTGLGPYRQYPFADHFAKLGWVGMCVEYRLMNKAAGTTVFDCVRDVRSAMRYVRSHAEQLGIDPGKIVVNGGSAGGHLAAGTALFDGVDEPGEDTSVSTMPDALVLYFPVIDTSKDGYGCAKIGERWRELSPRHHVRPGLPPTLLLHGTGDKVTPFAGAKAFHDAMLKMGNRCKLVTADGAGHGYLMRDRPRYEKAIGDTEAFLTEIGLLPRQ